MCCVVISANRRSLAALFVIGVFLVACITYTSYDYASRLHRQEEAMNVFVRHGCHAVTYSDLGKTAPSAPRILSSILPSTWILGNTVIYEAYCERRSDSDLYDILTDLPSGFRVRMISFDDSRVTDKFVDRLLEKCDKYDVESLWFSKCRYVTDTTVELAIKCPNASCLLLGGTSVTDRCFEILSSFNIKEIHVENTKVTFDGVSEFKKRHPSAFVVSDWSER